MTITTSASCMRWRRDDDRADGPVLWGIIGASIGLHIAVVGALPSAQRHALRDALPPIVIEMATLPPPPDPPPPPPTSNEIAPTPHLATVTARSKPAPTLLPATTTTSPLDFTSTVFSGEGAGLAMGTAPIVVAGGAPSVAASHSSKPPPPPPPPPRVVDPASLARKPRPPAGLDVELERQYPIDARRSGISGSAVLRVRILPSGRVGDVHVLSESWIGFGPACERTVRAAQWEPPIDKDGSPVATEITYTCRFEVRS